MRQSEVAAVRSIGNQATLPRCGVAESFKLIVASRIGRQQGDRTGKKVATLLSDAIRLVTAMSAPMFRNIDVVRYTQMSRALRVGEEYARRLLATRLGDQKADDIARQLVEKYPEHQFVIDFEEAEALGLRPTRPSEALAPIMEEVAESLAGLTAIGLIHERQSA